MHQLFPPAQTKKAFFLAPIALFLLLVFPFTLQAKLHDIIDNEDTLKYYLEKKQFAIDSNARAVILYEVGSSMLKDNILTFHVERTIKILNPAVADQVAMVMVTEIGTANIRNVHGVTYNLENGQIIKQNIEKADVVKNNITRHVNAVKFTLPSLKAGSVFHYSFTLEYRSFTSIQDWAFQHPFPTLLSKYTINLPSYYPVTFLQLTRFPFKECNSENAMDRCDAGTFSSNYGYGGRNQSWIRRNVPALTSEPYRKSDAFYQEMITANVSTRKWEEQNDFLFKNQVLYAKAFDRNGFLTSKVKKLTEGKATELEKAKAIFSFVRDSVVLDNNADNNGGINLSAAFDNRRGTLSEMNVLLAAMLRKAGIDADPLVFRTNSDRPLNPLFPNLGLIDYVAVYAKVDQQIYYLDASEKYLSFGMMPPYCYNGYSRIIHENGGASADISPSELSNNNVFFTQIHIDSALNLQLTIEEKLGTVAAYNFRTYCKQDVMVAKKSILKALDIGLIGLSDIKIENLNNPDKSLIIHITAEKTFEKGTDIIYLSTFYYKFFNQNPFLPKDRIFPVDFDYLHQSQYILRLSYPSNFKVTDIPQSSLIKLAGNTLSLQTLIQVDSEQHYVSLNSTYQLNTTTFPVSEYSNLQDFYSRLMKEQNSKIVLKQID